LASDTLPSLVEDLISVQDVARIVNALGDFLYCTCRVVKFFTRQNEVKHLLIALTVNRVLVQAVLELFSVYH
jgi:hypothetical protein